MARKIDSVFRIVSRVVNSLVCHGHRR